MTTTETQTFTNAIGRTFTVIAPTADCPDCSGTGTDPVFGGRCTCTLLELASTNRRIFAHGVTVPTAARPNGNGTGHGTRQQEGPTEKQVAFFTRLLTEKVPAEQHAALLAAFVAGTKKQASASIDKAMAMPRLPQQATPATPRPTTGLDLSGIPSGTYAVPGGDTRLKVAIKNVTKGKWAGWVFVSDGAVYGQQQRYGSQKPGGTYQGRLVEQLTAIAADPMAAAAAYGRLTGTCGVCSRPLEDADSVARGIGPVCLAKFA